MSDFVSIETGIWPKDIRGSHVIDRGFTTEIRKPTALHNTYSIYRTTERSMYFLTILGLCTLVAALPRVKRQVKSLMNKYTLTFSQNFRIFFSYFGRLFVKKDRVSVLFGIYEFNFTKCRTIAWALLFNYLIIKKIIKIPLHLKAWPRVALHALL